MAENDPLEYDIETSDATALAVSLLLEQTAEGLKEIDGGETKRYSLTLEIREQ